MSTETITALGIDIGGTKILWGVVDLDGTLGATGRLDTPSTTEELSAVLRKIITDQPQVKAVGIGSPGTINQKTQSVGICTNLPALTDMNLGQLVREAGVPVVAVDNDARCALIAEVWLGAAQGHTSAVLITVGTGIGGAVMQKGVVLPHPQDVSAEISRIMVDPTDVFPSPSGAGTVEAFIGGRSLEHRLQLDLYEQAQLVRKDDSEAIDAWNVISHYFMNAVRAIDAAYSPKVLVVAGKGSKDLEYYLQSEPPCPVIAAKLGEKAGMFGAARIALDAYDEEQTDWE